MSEEKECKCCHEWWYVSDIKNDLCPNCYDYFKQLKQQLEEKEKQIDMISRNNNSYKYNIDEQKRIIENFANQLKEKDKEIERLKDFIGCKGCVDVIKKSNENQTQLAIQELEKTKDLLLNESKNNPIIYDVNDDLVGGAIDKDAVFKIINQQIKELKGEKDDKN